METIKTHAFKIQVGTAVAVILFSIYSVYWLSGIKAEFQHKVDSCHEQVTTNKEHIVALEDKTVTQDLVIMEVRTKLANIESLLQDIKLKIN